MQINKLKLISIILVSIALLAIFTMLVTINSNQDKSSRNDLSQKYEEKPNNQSSKVDLIEEQSLTKNQTEDLGLESSQSQSKNYSAEALEIEIEDTSESFGAADSTTSSSSQFSFKAELQEQNRGSYEEQIEAYRD